MPYVDIDDAGRPILRPDPDSEPKEQDKPKDWKEILKDVRVRWPKAEQKRRVAWAGIQARRMRRCASSRS